MNRYWTILQDRAARFSLAQQAPGATLTDGLPVLAAHAAEFSAFHMLHVMQLCLSVIVYEDCPDHLRNSAGVPDLEQLVPTDTDALTILTTAERMRALFGLGLDEELRNVEDQVAGTTRAQAAVQQVLDQVPRGEPGRQRMLDIVYELRDDPRAIAAFISLTAAALRELAAQQGHTETPTGS
ncbi:hypothetical protein [Streptomyces sp. NPDC002746]